MIDVVIPVYRGQAETRACVESVLAARNASAFEVIVIDDASPEPALSAWLRPLAAEGRITLIVHAENRGFVVTCNEGMALHPDRDVVLLNSDTEVADGWLDRLHAHVERDTTIGTVTPFSSNATICSYPRTLVANALPAGETPASLDRAFAAANPGHAVDIPTAVGFCVLITRRCIERIGTFDATRYGTGYGEEVDFCMRAARAGYRNVLAGDVFVRHVGEVSFGASGVERRARAQATVDELYPEFQPGLREYLAADPALELRRRADLERLRRSPRPRLLFVSHPFAGGVQRHIEELAAALAGECEVLLLRPHLKSYAALTWIGREEEFALWFHVLDEWEALIGVLAAIGVARVHFHHVHGLPPAVLDLPRRLGAPHDVTVHDYVALCPRYHLTDASGRYCGERGDPLCMRCLDGGPAQWPLSIPEWRAAFHALLASAGRVIAPSVDAAERIQRYFPDVTAVVWPHARHEPPAHPSRVKILVPGGLSPAKGIDLLEACARDAKARGLPLHFRVVGYLARPLPPWPELPLSFTGEFREETLAELLALERGDAIFFPTQVPETFSYTLSAALDTGLPIVATDLGALPARLAGREGARIVSWKESPARVNDALMASANAAQAATIARPEEMSFGEYRARYLGAIGPAGAAPHRALPDVARLRLRAPHEDLPQPTLVELFDDGVRCGKATSLVALRDRAVLAEQERGGMHSRNVATAAERDAALAKLEAAQRRVAETAAALRDAEAGRAGARQRESELLASTSWKLTAPLRALVRWLRGRA